MCNTAEAKRKELEHCGTAQAQPACSVEIRYIYQVLRANPPEVVFAQTLLGFETVNQTIENGEPGFLGINFVQPEDGYASMHDYTLEMKMVDYLHSVYPRFTSPCMPANSRSAWSHPRACASTSARPSSSDTPSASATASTFPMKTMPRLC